jgi:AraC-like DNA-binding protein
MPGSSYTTHGISRLQMKSDWTIVNHSHEWEEMVLVVEGQVETRMAGRTTVAGPGMLKIHPRGVLHEERSVATTDGVLLCASWDPPAGVDVTHWPHLVADRTGRIRMLMEWMIELSPPHDPASAAGRDGLLQALSLAIMSASGSPSDDLVLLIRGWIRTHLMQPIYLEDLAQVAGMSRYHFNRLFHKAAGMPPMRFVREMRVDAARGLLLNTGMPLRVIAPMVGFNDEFQLSRVFREITGQSPAGLRKATASA